VPTQIPPKQRSSFLPGPDSYSHHVDDPTVEHPRLVTAKPKIARDTVRELEPEGATPLAAVRFPLDLRP
jgi:hypothetical protein